MIVTIPTDMKYCLLQTNSDHDYRMSCLVYVFSSHGRICYLIKQLISSLIWKDVSISNGLSSVKDDNLYFTYRWIFVKKDMKAMTNSDMNSHDKGKGIFCISDKIFNYWSLTQNIFLSFTPSYITYSSSNTLIKSVRMSITVSVHVEDK